MEVLRRKRGDGVLPPGTMANLRMRLRNLARQHDLTKVNACVFDFHSRILPFVFLDVCVDPGGVRAIDSALADAEFNKTRIVLSTMEQGF